MTTAYLRAIHHVFPAATRTNADLAALNPTWDEAKIFAKTGIRSRPIAAPNQTATDLGAQAALELFQRFSIQPATIDALVLMTQSPDYLLPASACVLQQRLGLPTTCAAFDVNLGCSAFPYGLWLARALVASESVANVLLICAETYSKYCDPHDMTTATLFGDGAAAALIGRDTDNALARIGPTVLGTDGAGAGDLIVPQGGARQAAGGASALSEPGCPRLHMNGPEVFRFALDRVKPGVDELLRRVGRSLEQIDLVLCHQANRFMLETLRQRLGVPAARFPIDVEEVGNASTASLPILLSRCLQAGVIRGPQSSLVVGFGVGYSWGMTYVEWLESSFGAAAAP